MKALLSFETFEAGNTATERHIPDDLNPIRSCLFTDSVFSQRLPWGLLPEASGSSVHRKQPPFSDSDLSTLHLHIRLFECIRHFYPLDFKSERQVDTVEEINKSNRKVNLTWYIPNLRLLLEFRNRVWDHEWRQHRKIELIAHVTINMCSFMMLLLHVSARIGHLQGGHLQRNDVHTKVDHWVLQNSVVHFSVNISTRQRDITPLKWRWHYWHRCLPAIKHKIIKNWKIPIIYILYVLATF
jgi:hypothetical protein